MEMEMVLAWDLALWFFLPFLFLFLSLDFYFLIAFSNFLGRHLRRHRPIYHILRSIC